jgi:hypothetical protein
LENTPAAKEKLKRYVLEAQRLSATLGIKRVCDPDKGDSVVIKNDQGQDTTVKKGEIVILNCVRKLTSPTNNLLTQADL